MKLGKREIRRALFTIIIFRVLLLILLDQHTYWTFDEPWNTDTAKQVLIEKQFRRTKDSFTPISIANVYVGEKLRHVFTSLDPLSSYRIAGIAINQLSVPLSFSFAEGLGASPAAALLFTLFISFEPNILGHTVLASNVDGYILTFFLLLAVVAFQWARKPSLVNMAMFGLVLGLAQGVKLTSAYAVPLCILWICGVFWKIKPERRIIGLFVFLFSSWFGLCLFYAFNKLGMPFNEIHFTSGPFRNLAMRLGKMPTFIPVDYLQGLDMCLQTDTTPRPVYIRNTFLLHGVWYYFLYVLLLKTPLPLLFSASIGWGNAARKKILNAPPHQFVLLFIFGFMIYFSFFFNAQIGMRYLFPIYGFLLAGLIWFPWRKAFVIISIVWVSVSIGYNWPNFIGYFNEIVWTKHHRWWHLGDSNLTWNQEWKDWPAFTGKYQLNNDQISPATFPINLPFFEDAITVSGILSNRQQLEVLRDHFSPFDSFWGVKLKYFISPSEVLSQFPPVPLNVIPSIEKDCAAPGWTDLKGNASFEGAQAYSPKVGEHFFKSSFNIFESGPVFLEIASKNTAALFLNGTEVLSVKDPTPNLRAITVFLKKGTYDAMIRYNKLWNDGFISVRGYALNGEGAETAIPLAFCRPE